MTLEHRRAIRLAELEAVLPLLPRSGRLLEVGAGAGWQAKALAEAGFAVTAIDVEFDHPSYNALRKARVWPVAEYDGGTIPCESGSFDVVFTSNTLPHIPDLELALGEMRRVMKDDGLGVHMLPTVAWRVWTSVMHFFNFRLLARGFQFLSEEITSAASPARTREIGTEARPPVRQRLFGLLGKALPTRLGERGNAWSELWLFSERNWKQVFARSGYVVERVVPCGVFNTGHHLLGKVVGIESRMQLAGMFGSSGKAYFLRRKATSR